MLGLSCRRATYPAPPRPTVGWHHANAVTIPDRPVPAAIDGLQPDALHRDVLAWYDAHARDLPWRAPAATPWGVLVSEVMLQQTPVARVEPVWEQWMGRWPTPTALAGAPTGEVLRSWGRLGYPRRALRLKAAASALVERHAGEVPADPAALLALPGIGSYTAAAVFAFAFGGRAVVVDTNVRRVLARALTGTAQAAPTLTSADTRLAARLLPDEPAVAARWSVAVMELGALVCTARAPACRRCPVLEHCAWQQAGCPPDVGPPRRGQAWVGTDRQVRGRLMAVLRESAGPGPCSELERVWDDPVQRERCLDALVADGLAERVGERGGHAGHAGHVTLPGGAP